MRIHRRKYKELSALMLAGLVFVVACASPSFIKQQERETQAVVESENFVVFVDPEVSPLVGEYVANALEIGGEMVATRLGFVPKTPITCNLYGRKSTLKKVTFGYPLSYLTPDYVPVGYVWNGEIHGRIVFAPGQWITHYWLSTFVHEYGHLVFTHMTGKQPYQYGWFQEGLCEVFRRAYLEKMVQDIPNPPGELLVKPTLGHSQTVSYTDWVIRNHLRYGTTVSMSTLNTSSLLSYARYFGTQEAGSNYAFSDGLVSFIIEQWGWDAIKKILAEIKRTGDLDNALHTVVGYRTERLQQLWEQHLYARWGDVWEPNIPLTYHVMGDWLAGGHEDGVVMNLDKTHLLPAHAQWHLECLSKRAVAPQGFEPVAQVLAWLNTPESTTDLHPHIQIFRRDPDGNLAETGELAVNDTLSLLLEDCKDVRANHVPRQLRGTLESLVDGIPKERRPGRRHAAAGLASYSEGAYHHGVYHFQQALDHDPDGTDQYRIHLARGLIMVGARTEALVLYAYEAKSRTDAAFLNEFAWVCEQAGYLDEALQLYQMIRAQTELPGLQSRAQRKIRALSAH